MVLSLFVRPLQICQPGHGCVVACIWSPMFTVTVPCSYMCMSGKLMVVIGLRFLAELHLSC